MLAAVSMAIALALSGCGASESDNQAQQAVDDTVDIGTTTDVVQWAPLNTVSITDLWITGQMYPTLFTVTAEGSLAPHAADSYEVSEDGSTIDVKLNPDFEWSDDEALTADDVTFTLDRLASDKLLSGARIAANYVSSEAVSPTEVKITMKVPSYGWALETMQQLAVLPKHVFEDVDDISKVNLAEDKDLWVGGGSTVLTEAKIGQSYTFEPNDNYPLRAEENKAIKKYVFKVYGDMNTMQLALQNGDIDIIGPAIPASSLSGLGTNQSVTIDETKNALNYSKMTINVSKTPTLADPDVRKVLVGLVDTDEILDSVLQGHGVATPTPILPALKDYEPDTTVERYTPDEAKSILAEHGASDLTINIGCDQGNANHSKSAQLIRDDLQEAGITVNLECAERTVSLAKAKEGGYDLYVHKLNQGVAAGNNLVTQFDPANRFGLTYSFFPDQKDDGVSKALLPVQVALNDDQYKEATKAAASYIQDQALFLPLYSENINVAYNSSKFTGYVATGLETTTMVSSSSLAQVIPAQ